MIMGETCGQCQRPATHRGLHGAPICITHLEDEGAFMGCIVCGENMFEKLVEYEFGRTRFEPVRPRVYDMDGGSCCWKCYEEAHRT